MDSLPDRPLALAEGRALHRSDAFRMVAPASAHTARDADERLVSALVLVRDGTVYGVGYDLDGDEWIVVHEAAFDGPEDAEDEAETANEALREWAGHAEREFEAVEGGVEAEAGESERAAGLFARYRAAVEYPFSLRARTAERDALPPRHRLRPHDRGGLRLSRRPTHR